MINFTVFEHDGSWWWKHADISGWVGPYDIEAQASKDTMFVTIDIYQDTLRNCQAT